MTIEPDKGIDFVPTGNTYIDTDRQYPHDSWAAWKRRALILQRMVRHLEATVDGLDARIMELEAEAAELRNNR